MTVRELMDRLAELPDYYEVEHGGTQLSEVQLRTVNRHVRDARTGAGMTEAGIVVEIG